MSASPQWQRWKNIMKCYPFEEKRLAKWSPPYIVQPKLDGDRCKNAPSEQSPLLLSSEENVFFSVPHINQQIVDNKLSSIPLDGELYNHKIFLEGGHELIHSICSRTVNLHPRYKEMELWVFDLQYFDKIQAERTVLLSTMPTSNNIRVIPYYICENLDEVKKVYNKLVNEGFEGIVVKNLNAFYEFKRSIYQMKFKPKKKDTYKIVGYNEEISKDGIPKGRLGSLVMSSKEGERFSVSAGLNDEEKERYWDIKELLIGLDATVHYQHLTERKVPKGSFDIEIHFKL